MLFSAIRQVAGARGCSLVAIGFLPFSLSVPCLGQLVPILTVTGLPCEMAPIPHLLDGDGGLSRAQSTCSAHRGLAPPCGVSIPGLGSSGECHFSP